MITWVVGPVSGARSPAGLSLWHPVDERVSWTSPAGDVAATCFVHAADKLPDQKQLVRTKDRIAALTGWPLAPGIDLEATPGALRRGLDDASGSFTWFSLEAGPAGTSGLVGSDALCTGLIYTADTPDGPLWSNDAGLLGEILGASPDVEASVWNAYSAFWVDDTTALQRVRTLPPGRSVRIEAGRAHLEGPSSVWLRAEPGDREDHLEDLTEGIKRTIRRTAETAADTRSLGLTGGKDSRMVLAAILATGVQDAFTFQTMGHEADPDVVAARMLAERFELQWERREPVATTMTADDFDTRARTHVFATRGMLNLWTLKGLGRPHDRIELTGQFGELQRSNFGALDPNLPVAEAVMQRLHVDAAGLLTDAARQRADQTVRDLVERMLADGVAKEDVIEAIFLDRRLRRWFGTAQGINQVNITGMPLMQPAALPLGRSLSGEERDAAVASLQVIERLFPDVLDVPMAIKPWSPLALSTSKDPIRAGQAPITGTKASVGQWQETLWHVTGPVFVHRLTDSSSLGTLFDADRMAHTLANYRRTPLHGRVSLWGAAASAMWVDGSWRVTTMGQPPAELPAGDRVPPVFPVPAMATRPPGRAWPADPDPDFANPMVPRAELDAAQSELERTTARLQEAEAGLRDARAAFERLRDRKVVRLGLGAADAAGRLARRLRKPTT